MAKKRTLQEGRGGRIVRPATEESRRYLRRAIEEEKAGMAANRALGLIALRERRELSQIVGHLKELRQRLGIPLSVVADRTGMTRGNLSRLENMDGPNPTIETLRRYAEAIGHRIEIAVVAQQ
ncbi:MAG: helix-turn-helix transcriptional regulator [Pirellulales bacterium]|nr:helix-turn-helix transcriptional regulator [Pirellulales bacterium]